MKNSKLKTQNSKLAFLLLLLTVLLSACGAAGTPEAETATPRPSPQLATPTPILPTATTVAAAPTATSAGTPTPTLVRRVTPSPTRNLLLTPTPTVDTSLTPTAIALTPPALNATPRPLRAIGGDLISAQEQEPTTFQPYGPPDAVSQQYRAMLFNARLLKRNPQTLEWEPNAAMAFKYDEGQKAVAVVLRNDIKWSDGRPITAADYVWTYTQALDPGKNWTGAAPFMAAIASYSAPDERTLLIKLKDNYSDPFEMANFVEPLPKHIWDGRSWSETDRNREILKPTVVSGPWKLKEWLKKDRISFVRNEASTISPPPYLNSLTFLYIPDSRKAAGMLARGEIDFYVPPADRYSEMHDSAKVITYRWNPALPNWNYLGFNFRRSLTADAAFRRALAAVTDRAELIRGPGEGRGTPMYSDVPPGHPAFTDKVEKYGGGLEQARTFLKEGGYSWSDTDGRLLNRQGQEIAELTLVYNMESQTREQMANYFKQQLGKLGVVVRIVSLDYLSYVNLLKQTPYDYDLFLGGWKATSPDVAQFGQNWKNNFSGYTSRELTDLYDKAAHQPEKNARFNLLGQIQQLEAKELPYLYLYAEQGYVGALFQVGGIEEHPLGPFAEQFSDWYVKG